MTGFRASTARRPCLSPEIGFGPSRAIAAALVVLLASTSPLRSQSSGPATIPGPRGASATTTVILVRHAERAAEPAADPVLSPAGETRARALADALLNARVTGIVTSQFQRTRLTAAPLAERLGLTPIAVATTGGPAVHARAVADSVRAYFNDGTVLVVGHSNTVTKIIAELGGPRLPDLCDDDFATMFVLVLRPGAEPSLTRARYGPGNPAAEAANPAAQAAARPTDCR